MINRQTFDFLNDLVENNNREWFMDNKARHDEAKENVISFTGELIKELCKVDPAVEAATDPKKCVMRIYRDVRFSLDKTPYKNSFGIGKLTKGKGDGVGYYIAGGYWQPQGDHLKAIRQEIDYNGKALKKIIDEPGFKELFGDFTKQEQLKSVPREYSADNENIALLKLKSFIAAHNLKGKELMKSDIVIKTAAVCSEIYPLNVFLNNAIL